MARLPRLYAPGLPQLTQAQFAIPLAAPDHPAPAALLTEITDWLGQAVLAHHVSVHGWRITLDRILLLSTPADEHGLPRVMQALGRNLAARRRNGPVYTGRYRGALIEPGKWVLPALVWLESSTHESEAPHDPERWPWSSAPVHTGAAPIGVPWLVDHRDYWDVGNTPFDRQARYRQQLTEGLSRADDHRITQAVLGQWALGGSAFVNGLAATASRRAAPGKRGRPPKLATREGDNIR